jgi:hypothetical protein
MRMSAATSHLSLEEFHRLYDGLKPYHEYWFGEAIAKPSATSLHGAVQLVLSSAPAQVRLDRSSGNYTEARPGR